MRVMDRDTPKISYCITCKGRAHHVQQTLPHNLALLKHDRNVEFVLLDYESNDGLGEWVQEHFKDELASGRLRYARYEPAPHFKMAHAKNMAHRVATGDILCNLDGDNFLAEGYTEWMRDKMTRHPHACVTSLPVNAAEFLMTRVGPRLMGKDVLLGGRVALWREDFYKLGGYDERYTGWSPDDVDMSMRAKEMGIKSYLVPEKLIGHTVPHDNTARLENLSARDMAGSAAMLNASKADKIKDGVSRGMSKRKPLVNLQGDIGCGEVRVNFSDELETLSPLSLEERGITDEDIARMNARYKKDPKEKSPQKWGRHHE